MNYLRGALSAASQYYKDINPSTLTGAIDVIVVRRIGEGGEEELVCSPFHVRFGKWQVLRPVDKKVQVLVNGQPIPFSMKIGDAGEAFFVFETEGEVPEDLITSPILEPTQPTVNDDVATGRFGAKEEEGESQEDNMDNEPEPLDLDATFTADAPKTPRPSGLSLSKPSPQTPTPPTHSRSNSNDSNGSPLNILDRTAHLGKAVVRAAVETEREQREFARDQIAAARNVAANAYRNVSFGRGQEQGDEALPPIKDGEGEPPNIRYQGDVVLDMAGYHDGSMKRTSGVNDNADTESNPVSSGPSTPRSGPSGLITPEPSTPGSSRPSSPLQRLPKLSRRISKTHAFPTFRANSEPPEFNEDGSPRYSWDWGAFPQPSPIKTTHPLPEVQRSCSVPPDFDSDQPSLQTPPRSYSSETPSPPSSPPTPNSLSIQHFGEGGELTADERNSKRFFVTLGGRTYEFELSICEGLTDGEDEIADAKRFKEGKVSFRRFMKYPAIVHDENLVVKWDGKYITRRDGSQLLVALVTWRDAALAKPANASTLSEEEPLSSSDEREPEDTTDNSTPKKTSSWVRWWRSSRSDTTKVPTTSTASSKTSPPSPSRPNLVPSASAPADQERTFADAQSPSQKTNQSLDEDVDEKGRRYAKTLRLTSDQLKQLDLKAGPNPITFSLSASGAIACTARIFLWEANDHVVVSDIDGTITKSDALGHVFTMIGRDWTHIGVAKLYTDIRRNGYKVMYLTSRAIGQADSTRDYLKGIKQNNYQLPEGPVIMSPDRLLTSLHREVIMKKPEVFKMACLRDIQRLFGEGGNPFYAGFGNRITDALSYRSVNIPSKRIFTIDSTGEVKMELLEVAGYKSSYIHMTDLVDQMFPPIHRQFTPEFTDFNYWRTPVQEFELPDLSPPSPALSARSDTSTQTTFSRIRNFSLGRRSGKQYAPPATVSHAGHGESGRRTPLRDVRSFEELRSGQGLARSLGAEDVMSEESGSSTLADSEDERRGRKRLSMDSMPGSLPGSVGSHFSGKFGDEDDEEEDGDGDDEEEYEDEIEDPEEAAEEGFDEDFRAMGEMENVPF
ncbi:LNS2-domain-containing protein [Schizopora paradoxa]|uniref:phosphatidate phosphatase n=1 Tax=Schizopora paradoxa TaxID=27342 RepID=A0A0H2S6P8_9AGAM|nr:LNS2-domain-containing protein [Schizopora paradoxa]